jgi:Chitin binding Peritrophin-A domain
VKMNLTKQTVFISIFTLLVSSSSVDDYKEATVIPGTVPPLTAPANTWAPSTISTIVEQLCDGVMLDILANPNSCTSFIRCVFGTGDLLECPSAFPVFEPLTKTCVAGRLKQR